MLEAMVYILRVGCPWRDLPETFGPWQSVYTRWRRWTDCGLWERLLGRLARYAQGKLRFADATCCKVHAFGCGGRGGYTANAIGKTRGGNNTKVHALVDARGRVLCVLLGAGHRHDSQMARALSAGMRRGQTIVADKAYDSNALRRHWRERGLKVCVPARAGRRNPASHHKGHYRRRHKVENFFQRLKKHLRVDRRLEKLSATFLAFVQLSSILDWIA